MKEIQENWKDVVGYEGHYRVSDLGRVYSIKSGRILMDYPSHEKRVRSRYRSATLCVNGQYVSYGIRHLVLNAFVGPRPEGMQACHNNGDSRDDRLSNLRWDTAKSNSRDRVNHGTQTRGENVTGGKLQPKQVLRIRHLLKQGFNCTQLSEKYGVSITSICNIQKRKTWTHI